MEIETLPEALQWSEGMMISPQHFQQNDIYWNQMLRHVMAQLQPNYWGVIDMQLNTDNIAAGEVVVERLHCVMPDGLVIQHPLEGQDDVLSVNVADHDGIQANGKSLRVFLTVPIRREGSASSSAPIQRYKPVSGNLVLDENTGTGSMAIERLRPIVELLPGEKEKIPAKFVAMPLFELTRDEAGLRISSYHPPLLRIGASGFLSENSLQARLEKLTRDARAKAYLLAGVENEKNPSSMPIDHRYRTIIRALVSSLPSLEVLVSSQTAHPFDIYRALASFDGQISALHASQLPMKPAPYDHDDMYAAFDEIIVGINSAIDDLQLAYTALHFQADENAGSFRLKLEADLDVSRLLIEIRPRPGQSVRRLGNWLTQSRIAREDLMQDLVRRRQAGANSGILTKDQIAGLGVDNNSLLCEVRNVQIDIDGKKQDAVQADKYLVIEGGGLDDLPAAIVLHIPNKRPAAARKG